MGKEFSRDTFLTELKSILQEMPEEYFEEKTVAQAVALVIKKANITDLLLSVVFGNTWNISNYHF
jgi:MarR-like DNA-binding transcriptional regulator SgrR of sgrS sRNA